jgi:hypothetical protein
LPNTRLPVWDSKKSPIRNPFLLFEGRNAQLVEEGDVTYRSADEGRIFVERMPTMKIRTDPRKVKYIDRNGEQREKTLYTLRDTKAGRRKSKIPKLRSLSASMTPGHPTRGSIAFSPYANLLDAFANGCMRSRKLLAARRGAMVISGKDKNGNPIRRGASVRNGVPKDVFLEISERSILFMPSAGQITSKSEADSRPARENVCSSTSEDTASTTR